MPTTSNTPTKAPRRGTKPVRRRIAGERRPHEGTSAGPTAGTTAGTSAGTSAGPTAGPAAAPSSATQSKQPTPAKPAAAQRPSRWMLVVAGLLVVAVVVMATFVVRGQLQSADAAERAEALDSALTAAPARAEEAAKALLSYSHDSIGDDIARTTPFLTKEYAEEYTTTMREVVSEPAKQTKATVRAEVLSSGIVAASPERTDVLVFVNQVTESTNSDKPRTALNRAILTMVQRDGEWVVGDLKGL